MSDLFCLISTLILFIYVIIAVYKGVVVIAPDQEGVYIFMGQPRRILKPGINFVSPVMRTVVLVNMREQSLEIRGAEATTADSVRVLIDVEIRYRIVDSMKAVFEVQNYKVATEELFRAFLKVVMGRMRYEEFTSDPSSLSEKMRDEMNKAAGKWGMKISAIYIKEISVAGMEGSGEARLFSHLNGKRGRVVETIDPYHLSGVVEIDGKRYNARGKERIEQGSLVVVESPEIILNVRKEEHHGVPSSQTEKDIKRR